MTSNQAGMPLDPLQQTIFEKGPQNAFEAPPVENVYQEGRDILPSNNVAIQTGINWYGLGQEAFDLANKTFGNVQDYLIETKRNSIVDAKDQAQSKLLDIESKISAESYNANHEYRPRDPNLVNELLKQSAQIREDYNNKIKTALGEDYSTLADPNLDMNTLGTKYQALALSNRNSDRDIDRTTNNIIYKLERVTRGAKTVARDAENWFHGQGSAPSTAMPLVFSGFAPVPMSKSGAPLLGADVKEDGSFQVKQVFANGQSIPLLRKNEQDPADKNLYLNTSALDYFTHDELKLLVDADKYMVPGSYNISMAGDTVDSIKDMAKQVATNVNVSTGVADYLGIVLSSMPDAQADAYIKKVTSDSAGQMKLSMVRSASMSGVPQEQYQDITALAPDKIQQASYAVNLLKTGVFGSKGLVLTNENSVSDENLNDAAAALHLIEARYGNTNAPISKFNPSETKGVKGFQDDQNGRAAEVVRNNPFLAPVITRALVALNSNPQLYTDNGTVNSEKKAKVLSDIINQQVNNTGFVRLDSTADGIPRYIYNPGLGYMNEMRATAATDPIAQVGWSDADKQNIKDPIGQNKILSKIPFAQTIPNDTNSVLSAMGSMGKNVDSQLLTTVLAAYSPVERDPKTGVITSDNGAITQMDAMRLCIACNTYALREKGIEDITKATEAQKLAAVKSILDDLPTYSSKRPGFAPWLETTFDLSPGSRDYAVSSNGGLPVGITKIVGESGKDYMPQLTSAEARSSAYGIFTPRSMDGTPSFMIPAISKQFGDAAPRNEGVAKDAWKKISAGMRGEWKSVKDTMGEVASSVLAKDPEYSKKLIFATTEPYIPESAQAIFANKLVDQPLKDSDSAIAYVHQNGAMLEKIMTEDSTLKPVKDFLLSEAAYVHGTEAPDDKKSLFSSANMHLLYDQAVAHGAKTQGDFVGFVLGAAKNAAENPRTILTRDFEAQAFTKSSEKDSVVLDGPYKGRILWSEMSAPFKTTVLDQIETGKTIFSGPSPEDPKKTAYFAMDVNDPRAKENGYTMLVGPESIDMFKQSKIGKDALKLRDADRTRNFLFPTKRESVVSVRAMSRQSTMPSTMQDEYKAALGKFLSTNSMNEHPDMPFIDLAGYYLDNGKMPDNIESVSAKYILPGHSLTMPWTDTPSSSETVARAKRITQAIQDINIPAADTQFQQYNEQLAAGNAVVAGINNLKDYAAYPLGYIASVASEIDKGLKDAGMAVLNLDSTLQKSAGVYEESKSNQLILNGLSNSKNFAMSTIEPWQQANRKNREEVLNHYSSNPSDWLMNMVYGDTVSGLRRESQLTVKTPEVFFNAIYQVKDNKDIALNNPAIRETPAFTDSVITKIKSLDMSPLEIEYQARLKMQESKEGLAKAINRISTDEFALDSVREDKLAADLFAAYRNTGSPITKQEAKVYAALPSWKPDLKKAYFNITLHPDGFIARPGMTAADSRVQALTELLKTNE